jgi:ribonuclease III
VSLSPLCRALDYRFRNPELLETALTHRSSAGSANNERLEFLGDALLNCVIALAVFERYPQASEGDLSRLRASLVKGDTLAGIAGELELGSYLHLGGGEMKSGGYRRHSILADALEAVFGAVYLDSDFATCRLLILRLFDLRLASLPPVTELKDPKTRLQEYLQSRQRPLPAYHVRAIGGEPHAQRFTIECAVEGLSTVAEGSSRRKAEQAAASEMLERIR